MSPIATSLDFSQRFIGKFAPDGDTITAAWRTATDEECGRRTIRRSARPAD